jgi:hypothetical protein
MIKLADLLKENWDVNNGKVLSNGKLVGYYEFNRDSDSFWVDDVKKGKGQLSFETKKEVEDYFKKNEKDAIKHLGKLRESVSKTFGWIEYNSKQVEPEIKKVLGNLIKNVQQFEKGKDFKGHVQFNFVDKDSQQKFLSKQKFYISSIEKALSRKFSTDVMLAPMTRGNTSLSFNIFSEDDTK